MKFFIRFTSVWFWSAFSKLPTVSTSVLLWLKETPKKISNFWIVLETLLSNLNLVKNIIFCRQNVKKNLSKDFQETLIETLWTLIGISFGISFWISIRVSIGISIRISILKNKWVYLKSLQTWPRSGFKEWLLSSLQKLTQIYLLETSQNSNLRLNIWIEECFWPLLSNLKNGYYKISTLEHLTKLFITLDWVCSIEL